MIILDRPNFPPYVCITCGVGSGRKWFVSLDFPLDNYFNPVNDGIIFQCNECWESLATRVAKLAQEYIIGQEPWDSKEYIEPQYEDKTELVKEVSFGPGTDHTVPTSSTGILTIDSGSSEPSNPEPSTGDSTTDVPDDAVSDFRNFFDDGGGSS